MKIDVSVLTREQLHALMREERIPFGILKTLGGTVWLEYYAPNRR